MTVDLTGRVAAITGGSRGIGRAIAEHLLAAGASVGLNGRSQDKGDAALAELDVGERAMFVAGDVTCQSDVEGFVAAVAERYGRVDILINNAGGSSGFAPVAELTDDAWQEAAAWILHSAFWATRAALPHMQRNGFGRIINISSVEGRQANKENVSHYITFKHALNGFTKAVAFENGTRGVTCNAISPGAVETDLMRDSGPAAAQTMGISYEEFKDGYAQDAAIKRLNTVDEVAGLALFLVSELGGGMTGAILPVDGGTAL
ncbi:MAG: SDR family NAD(P)-dependent oxidoreductase [Pseudomonadales bacterium]